MVNVLPGRAQFATGRLRELGAVEPAGAGGDRLTLAPDLYRAVLRQLERRNLL